MKGFIEVNDRTFWTKGVEMPRNYMVTSEQLKMFGYITSKIKNMPEFKRLKAVPIILSDRQYSPEKAVFRLREEMLNDVEVNK